MKTFNSNKKGYILDSYRHKLRFRIDPYAPKPWMDRWKQFKNACESGERTVYDIVKQWKSNCRLNSNNNIPLLNRSEGGIGGNNNKIHKQIRFRNYFPRDLTKRDNDIVMDQIYNTETEKWTYDELDDLICAFIKTANLHVKEECVFGCIEMIDENS